MNFKSPKLSSRKFNVINNHLSRFSFPLLKVKDIKRKMSISILDKKQSKDSKNSSFSFHNENKSNKKKKQYNNPSNKNNRYSFYKKSMFSGMDNNSFLIRKKSCVLQTKNDYERYNLENDLSTISNNTNHSFMILGNNLKKEINKMKKQIQLKSC